MKNIFLVLIFFAGFSVYSQNVREVSIYVPPIEGSGSAQDNTFFFRQITYEVITQHHSLVRTRRSSDFILSGKILSIDEILLNEDLFNDASNNNSLNGHSLEEDTLNEDTLNQDLLNQDSLNQVSSNEHSSNGHSVNESSLELFSRETYVNLFLNNSGMEYVFILELSNSVTNEVIARQSILYNTIDNSIADYISIMVFNMLSVIPEIEVENNWYNDQLYIDLSVLWAPRAYISENQSIHWFNFGIGITAEYHFLDFLSVELGVQFSQDWVVISSREGDDERDLILEVPLALKYVFKPTNYLAISPYFGALYNYPVMGRTIPSGFSAFAGLEISLKAGSGMVTINPRFAFDLSISSIPERIEYQRYMMQIGIGYKIGFFPK